MNFLINEGTPFERAKIGNSILDTVGGTPMIRLRKLDEGNRSNIFLKLESHEPCSSVKDRISKSMIEEAERKGQIFPGVTTLIEPTSGNTGVGLAMCSAAKGYDLILTMPASMSLERIVLLRAFGAKVILTPPDQGMIGAIQKAEEIARNIPHAYLLHQFNNPDNPKTHRETTGPEIWFQVNGVIDYFVCGVGTGGTITGVSQFLKSMNPSIKTVAVEPKESSVLSGGVAGPHKIQGIGAGFVPANCDTSLIDSVITVSSEDSMIMSRFLAAKEGILCGISSGAAVHAALQLANQPEGVGKNIVVMIPSFGERYLSTALFSDLFEQAKKEQLESLIGSF